MLCAVGILSLFSIFWYFSDSTYFITLNLIMENNLVILHLNYVSYRLHMPYVIFEKGTNKPKEHAIKHFSTD